MTSRPLVSCITIFYDAAPFLAEAIDSVLAQRYEAWELLLVDDGSTDGSTAIARAAAEGADGRIRYLEHEGHRNLGMSASRNLGVHHARGELIALLDADDLWLPEKLARQVEILGHAPGAAMVFGATTERAIGVRAAETPERRRTLGVAPDTLVHPPRLVPIWLRGLGETPGTCGVLVRREAALAVAGFEESFRALYEDQAFFYKLALRYPIFVSRGSWDIYRRHEASAVSVGEREGVYHPSRESESHRRFLEWLARYLRASGLGDSDTAAALRRALMPYERPRTFRAMRWLSRRPWIPRRVRGWLGP
jgi:glycosyltransferase involved in cell wall biosynthesis